MKKKTWILGGVAVIAIAGICYGLFGRGEKAVTYESRPTVSVEIQKRATLPSIPTSRAW